MCLVFSSIHVDCFIVAAENVPEYKQKYFSQKYFSQKSTVSSCI